MTRRRFCLRSSLRRPSRAAVWPASRIALRQAAALQSSDLAGLRFRGIGPATMSGRFVDMDVVESNPFTMYVASATGGMYRTTDNGVTWAPVFEREAVHSIGDVAIYQPDPNIIWVGTGERANRQSVELGRRRLQDHRRREDVDQRRPQDLHAHRPHRHAPVEPGDRLRGGAGIGVGTGRRARALSHDRRRQDVAADAARGRRHRRHRRGDGCARSERAVCGVVSAAAQRVRLQRRRSRQRAVEEHRCRRDVDEADRQRLAGGRVRPHRHRGVSQGPARRDREHRAGLPLQRVDGLHRAARRPLSQQRRRQDVAVHVELESAADVREPADHRSAGRPPRLHAQPVLVLRQRRRDVHLAATRRRTATIASCGSTRRTRAT